MYVTLWISGSFSGMCIGYNTMYIGAHMIWLQNCNNIHSILTNTLIEPPRDKTNNVAVRPGETQINLGIRTVWSESSLCAQWIDKDPSFLHADSEDSDQTGRMPRLIWVFAGRTLTLLVLSRGGSIFIQSLRLNWWVTLIVSHSHTKGKNVLFTVTRPTVHKNPRL